MRESRAHVVVRRAVITAAAIYATLFAWSIVRRTNQIFGLEVVAPSVIHPGSVVGYSVLTSGTVPNPIRLELVQGSQTEVLIERRGRLGAMDPWDVRLHRDAPSIVVTPATLQRFQAGRATLRLTGFGLQKLLRTPADRVRELEVTLALQP